MEGFRVRQATWQADWGILRHVRESVFVLEQGVPRDLEWDEWDRLCWHVLAETEDRQVIGTGRLLPDGHIGRMAVLQPWRRRGVGTALLAELLRIARDAGMTQALLHAQTHAVAFYARQGFVPEGRDFLEAGIPHRRMHLELAPSLIQAAPERLSDAS